MKLKRLAIVLAILFSIIWSLSCNRQENSDYDPNTSYWSINQFIRDQYNIRMGTTNAIKKIVTLNGKTDSSYMRFEEVDWATVFKIFAATDISNPKFYNKYKFDNFDDNTVEMSTMTYTALQPDLYVRRLDVNYDNISGLISMVYIETSEDGWFNSKIQKLSYYVGRKIVIQESEHSRFSKDKDLVVTYEFR